MQTFTWCLPLLQFATSVHGRNLDFITDDLVDTGEFLSNFSSDPSRLLCLKRFIEHQELVRWIRQETGSKDFHAWLNQ